MPSTKSPQAFDNPLHTLDVLTVATTEIMWAAAVATTRTAVASTARSLELWSQMLRTPAGSSPWSFFARPPAPRKPDAAAAPPLAPLAPSAPAMAAEQALEEPAAFASYRSSSGHAAAQVVKPH